MYWLYLMIFISAVLVPDIVRTDFYFLTETRLEEVLIFSLGLAGFLIFIFKEHQLFIQKEEKDKSQKRLKRTAKDLVDSYSYIGEVNRKMDILMQIGLGLSDRSVVNRKKEKEIYFTIINAANSLVKATCSHLRFVNIKNQRTKKEINTGDGCSKIKNNELLKVEKNVNFKVTKDYLVASSPKKIDDVKSYLLIEGYDKLEAENANNQELLKYLAVQALFLHAYIARGKSEK
jgi:hypothetical protein